MSSILDCDENVMTAQRDAQHLLEPDRKFALLAAAARVDLPKPFMLQDGTRVEKLLPFGLVDRLPENWETWLGTAFLDDLLTCNIVLVRAVEQGWKDGRLRVCDEINQQLESSVGRIFTLLRLVGAIEYTNAFLLTGYIEQGKVTCQRVSATEHMHRTSGCLPWVIREADLRIATELSASVDSLWRKFPDAQSWRLGRGIMALRSALEKFYCSERLHGFIRALEALILPGTGRTKKDFVNRGSMFAGPISEEAGVRSILEEAYRMRCDVEHLHPCDRSVNYAIYPPEEHKDLVFRRTRQMEALACAVYKKIMLDESLQQHFLSDDLIAAFWKQPEDRIREAFGNPCDITKLGSVKKYDQFGRAHPSEWPLTWLEGLTPTFRAAMK
jgi:hypothetical protein